MRSNGYTVGLYTLGCKVSLYETEAVAEAFSDAGFTVLPFDEVCDAYVINTCTVTAESDAKSRKYIRRALRKNPSAAVIVIGCYSQRAPDEVLAIDGVGAVIGTADKLSAVECAKRLLLNRDERINLVSSLDGASFEPMCVRHAPRTRAYVKIEDGCECKCTYCAISAARGPVRSKRPEDVISEVEALYAGGVREIVLTGIETGSYGADFDEKYTLADLLCELDARHSCERIRLGSMAPELLSESFISRVAGLSILVPHFHVSMQSGSNSVLRAMKRRYTRERALENIKRIRSLMGDVMITADLMVGFPSESEEDFLDTMRFVSEARLLDAHVFAYSKREGTPAASYAGQIPESVKRERSARLISEVSRVRDEVLSSVVARGEPLMTVLEECDGEYFTGHSDSYIEVRVRAEGHQRGELVRVHPRSHSGGVVYGEII
ncbi:MAG: tRNA (N(6)-L-threonylcarbamoyladenosine(37)-C(2))-methylthiotransferase MtaB [Clostridia bacterium]|nr:tRNA (N(6)-L-threonylcarbamoyladenosine(37)-C(2))-methylthiotransferase MtaB [Clostridia bacterium]